MHSKFLILLIALVALIGLTACSKESTGEYCVVPTPRPTFESEAIFIDGLDTALASLPSDYQEVIRTQIQEFLISKYKDIYDKQVSCSSEVSSDSGSIYLSIQVGKFDSYVGRVTQNKFNGEYSIDIKSVKQEDSIIYSSAGSLSTDGLTYTPKESEVSVVSTIPVQDTPVTSNINLMFDKDNIGKSGTFILPFRGTNPDVKYTIKFDSNVGSSSKYDQFGRPHTGVDMIVLRDGVNPEGSVVNDVLTLSPVSGTISNRFDWKKGDATSGSGSMGNSLWIDSDEGDYRFIIMHMSSMEDLHVGDKVERGQVIGKLGFTGRASGYNHVHMSLMPKSESSINVYVARNPWSFELAWLGSSFREDYRDNYDYNKNVSNIRLNMAWTVDDSISEVQIQEPCSDQYYSNSRNQVLLDEQIVANSNGHRPTVVLDEADAFDNEYLWAQDTFKPEEDW